MRWSIVAKSRLGTADAAPPADAAWQTRRTPYPAAALLLAAPAAGGAGGRPAAGGRFARRQVTGPAMWRAVLTSPLMAPVPPVICSRPVALFALLALPALAWYAGVSSNQPRLPQTFAKPAPPRVTLSPS